MLCVDNIQRAWPLAGHWASITWPQVGVGGHPGTAVLIVLSWVGKGNQGLGDWDKELT